MNANDQSRTGSKDFRCEQRGVGRGIALAMAITLIILGLAAWLARSQEPTPFDARLEHALRLVPFVVVWLFATIANVARLRFFSERDIGGGGSEDDTIKVREARAILQNTLEQVVLAVAAQLVVAASFNPSGPLVVALAGLFAIGRLLFWIGYRRGARGRALGFGLTFYPSVIALFASATVNAL